MATAADEVPEDARKVSYLLGTRKCRRKTTGGRQRRVLRGLGKWRLGRYHFLAGCRERLPCGGRPYEVLSPMRGTIYFLVLMLLVSSSLLKAKTSLSQLPGATVVEHSRPPPGLLESFLKANPNATVYRHNLGGLSAPSRASVKFIAVVASDTSHPEREAKGVEVVLKNGKTNKTVYLDYDPYPDGRSDSLDELARSLTNIAKREGQRFKAVSNARQGAAPGGQSVPQASMTGAQDRPGYLPSWCCPRYTHVNIGLYRRGAFAGVIIGVPAAKPVVCLFPRDEP